ncbi:MAG: hypothetical protein Q8O83_05170 [bacterium]|nr:hypothetical protein [bacterium]
MLRYLTGRVAHPPPIGGWAKRFAVSDTQNWGGVDPVEQYRMMHSYTSFYKTTFLNKQENKSVRVW